MELLLIGASGRVGRLLRRSWGLAAPGAPALMCHARDGSGDLDWDPWSGSDAFRRALARRDAPAPQAALVLAGVTPGPGARLDLNAALARACLDGLRAAGIGRVLFASSAAVYGAGDGRRPFSEEDAPRPDTAYGAAKLDAEAEAAWFRDGGMEVAMLRIGNVLGADALMANAAHASPGAPLALDRFADGGGPLRSYIGPVSLARVIAALAAHPGPLPGVLNVAARRPVAMAEILGAAGVPWRWAPAPSAARQRITLDCERLAALIPHVPLAAAPAAMVAELRAPPPGEGG